MDEMHAAVRNDTEAGWAGSQEKAEDGVDEQDLLVEGERDQVLSRQLRFADRTRSAHTSTDADSCALVPRSLLSSKCRTFQWIQPVT